MTRKIALNIVEQLKQNNGPKLTLLEAMMMTKLPSDAYEVYAIQKGDVTFMAWVRYDGSVIVKTTCW